MDHLLIYDTETASLKFEDGLVEHAFIEIDDDLKILREECSLIKPPGAISPGASGVHGITLDDVKDAPSIEEFWDSYTPSLEHRTVLMIAHNAPFDAKYLAPFVGELHTLCTLKLARIAFPLDVEGQEEGYVPPPDHKLPTLMFYLGLARKGTHNALDDVYTCYQLLQAIQDKLQLPLEDLYHLANKVDEVTGDTKMPFGKHRGTKLKELPKSYIQWLLDKADNLDPALRAFLEKR